MNYIPNLKFLQSVFFDEKKLIEFLFKNEIIK